MNRLSGYWPTDEVSNDREVLVLVVKLDNGTLLSLEVYGTSLHRIEDATVRWFKRRGYQVDSLEWAYGTL